MRRSQQHLFSSVPGLLSFCSVEVCYPSGATHEMDFDTGSRSLGCRNCFYITGLSSREHHRFLFPSHHQLHSLLSGLRCLQFWQLFRSSHSFNLTTTTTTLLLDFFPNRSAGLRFFHISAFLYPLNYQCYHPSNQKSLIMYSKLALAALLLATAEARFGQEQSVASIISSLSNFGNPGVAPTLAGATPGVLLAGANACDKLTLADRIVSELGNDKAVIDAAKKLVAAEKNFNPFAVSIPSICSDPALPATQELRGIVPLVDPAVTGADVENANSAKSLTTPFANDGLSVADIVKANGFSNFTAQSSSGSTTAPAAGNNNNNNNDNNNNNNNNDNNNDNNNGNTDAVTSAVTSATPAATSVASKVRCSKASTLTTIVQPAATSEAADAGNGNDNNDNNSDNNGNNNDNNGNNNDDNSNNGNDNANTGNDNNSNGVQKSTLAGADFGLCVPTMSFVGGRGNRKATEFTFLPKDPLVAKGQQEALNPNIITNRICDQLTNVCQANQAAKTACLDAKAQIQALGTKDASTAQKWNELLGFAGTDVSQ
ncbi:uncharacterized protein B0T23DRAFT_57446 [Neurospora hispaniola]|uniref:Circumsporozoite protein n=1 Tax=Neurospora hispaniola TaxID=588809 RepID=A0AAJ0HXR7_9PEZI|nr:hypothetical protein B0T23DRAFT_57446 [Neurospora hispaniola]